MADGMAEVRERIAAIETLGDIASRDRAEILKTMASLGEKIDALDKKVSAFENQARGAMTAGAAFKALAITGWGLVLTVAGASAAYIHKLGSLAPPAR